VRCAVGSSACSPLEHGAKAEARAPLSCRVFTLRLIDPRSVTQAIIRIGRAYRSGTTCTLGTPKVPLPHLGRRLGPDEPEPREELQHTGPHRRSCDATIWRPGKLSRHPPTPPALSDRFSRRLIPFRPPNRRPARPTKHSPLQASGPHLDSYSALASRHRTPSREEPPFSPRPPRGRSPRPRRPCAPRSARAERCSSTISRCACGSCGSKRRSPSWLPKGSPAATAWLGCVRLCARAGMGRPRTREVRAARMATDPWPLSEVVSVPYALPGCPPVLKFAIRAASGQVSATAKAFAAWPYPSDRHVSLL